MGKSDDLRQHTNPTELSALRHEVRRSDELLGGIKRRIGMTLNNTDASPEWLLNQVRGMQRFILEWERRATPGSQSTDKG